jgi:hypothetical protein
VGGSRENVREGEYGKNITSITSSCIKMEI